MQAGGSKVCDFGFPEPRGNPWLLEPTGQAGWLGARLSAGGGLEPAISHPHLSIAFLRPGILEAENVLYLQE